MQFAAQQRALARALEEAGVRRDVREAMGRVPRHRFVPEAMVRFAYADDALPIGCEQTISQPSLVGLMTEKLEPSKDALVLEIGTGSGYQTAILAELFREVLTIEIVPELARRAPVVLAELGYRNVAFREGDGYAGWPERAPFDAILVTASAPVAPQPLLDQLARGGRMVVPVGGDLLRFTRDEAGRLHREWVCAVSFVPMTGAVRG